MAEFEVNTGQLKRNANSEDAISQKIDSLGREIRSIAGRISLDSSSERSVKNNLNALADGNFDYASKIKILSRTLNEIAACYEQTEQRIGNNQASDKNGIRNEISEISGRIREVEDSLGMDHAAEFSDDPVNLSNGNYVYEKNFFNFDTILPINLRFFYNGKGERTGSLGTGWIHNFEKCIYAKDGSLRILAEDGSEQVFAGREGEWTACAGSSGELRRTETGYLYIDEQGYLSRFDADGRFLSQETRDGWAVRLHYEGDRLVMADCTDQVTLSFSYNEEGKLAKVSDHTGRTVSIGYEGKFLSEIRDPQGNTTKYQYSESGYLQAIVTPLGNTGLFNEFDAQGRTIAQTFPDGGQVKFLYDDENGSVTMVRQNGGRTVYFHDSLYRNTKVVYSDGEETTTFNENHQKTSFTDKLGNRSLYAYDGDGRLTEFTNALGNRMQLLYTENGQLREVQLDGMTVSSCEFDDCGHQIKNRNARGFETEFGYDSLGRVTRIVHEDASETRLFYDRAGNITRVEDPLAGTTEYVYDDCRRVIKTTDALGNETCYAYDAVDQLTEVTDAKGNRRTYTYDAQGNVIRIQDFNNGVVSFAYNAMNKPVHMKDADGNSTYYQYDLMSNVTKVIAADGGETSYQYDLENRRTAIRYPSGGEEKAVYDAAGNLVRRTAQDGGVYEFQYDALGRPVQITDPVGQTRRAVFDGMGNMTDIFYEDGSEEHFTFDLMGNRISWQDKNGYRQYYSYDALNHVTQVRDDQGVLAEYTYLPGGRLLSERRIDGACTEYQYDAAGNVISARSSTEGVWNFAYDSLGQVIRIEHEDVGIETYEYDAVGNVTAVIDGEGNRSVFEYSPGGSLIRVTDPAGVQTGYRYDGCQRLMDILQPENGKLDITKLNEYNRSQKEIRITSYTRDAAGNVTKVQDPEGNTSEYEYDLCGRITGHKDPEGNVTRCIYRKDGTEEKICFQDGRTIQYQYDALKRLSKIEDWLGTTRFQRDAEGRLLHTTDHQNRTTSYEWSSRGECRKIVYPDGNTVSYQYDDCLHLVETACQDQTVQYSYYENGLRKDRRLSNGQESRYLYHPSGNISELCHLNGGKILDRYQYFYDGCGRKSRMIEVHEDIPALERRFSYNALGSLDSVEGKGVNSESYSYDIFGNCIEACCNGRKTTYEYDRLNQMISSTAGPEVKKYTYDRRGNLTGVTQNGINKLTLQFDALNRLAGAKSDTGEAVYEYNGLDQLTGIRKISGQERVREDYTYDYTKSFHHLLTFRRDDREHVYIWDQELLFEKESGGLTVFLNDERMSPVRLLHGDGTQERYAYDLWGKQTAGTQSESGNLAGFGFTGYRHDCVTGFYHAGKRKYDSESGRFIAQDPVPGSVFRPITCNAFIYCMGDPVNRYDPTGAVAAWIAGGIIGAVSNIAVKVAGDIVESVKTGHVSISPWQEYAGTAAGGFVQGSVFVATGGNAAAAGAAGGATETFLSNGLKMATGMEGYRKEDGYNAGKLFMDTAKSAAGGAASGFLFKKATSIIKIPGITSGRGNWDAVVRGKLTAAAHGYVKNIGMKTIMKGVATQGLLKTFDTVLTKGKKELKDFVKDKIIMKAVKWLPSVLPIGPSASLAVIFNRLRTAECPAAGV